MSLPRAGAQLARRAFASSADHAQQQPFSSSSSLFERLASKARELVTGQKLVGRDQHGNAYYSWRDSTGQERRRVVVSGGDHLYDPNRLPPAWRAWLQRTRDDAPTREEAARADERARVMRARVAAIEERERQRRLARELGGGGGGAGGSGAALGSGGGGVAQIMQDMRRADEQAAAESGRAGSPGGGAGQQGR